MASIWPIGSLVLFVLLALGAAGCGSSGSESKPADEPKESTTTAPAPAKPAAPDASPYVLGFGDLSALSFPAGDPGELEVVSTGAQDELSDAVTVIVRNNTSDPIGLI